MRLCQLGGIDTAKIVKPFTKDAIASLWAENEYLQGASVIGGGGD